MYIKITVRVYGCLHCAVCEKGMAVKKRKSFSFSCESSLTKRTKNYASETERNTHLLFIFISSRQLQAVIR